MDYHSFTFNLSKITSIGKIFQVFIDIFYFYNFFLAFHFTLFLKVNDLFYFTQNLLFHLPQARCDLYYDES